MSNGDRVLLTGLSGFVARHVAVAALQVGYRIRGTVRSQAKGQEALDAIRQAGVDPSDVEVVEADLTDDANWSTAASGCRFVLHTASPFPNRLPREKFALVPIARDGTMRVLHAAEAAGAERVVVTSSIAAIYYGHEKRAGQRFTETDWSNVASPLIGAYAVSKTLAERAAWDFAANARFELVTINPSVVFGPLIGDEYGTSVGLLRQMLRGRMPFVPRVALGIVDVRDVAAAHVRALTVPAAVGRRFIASGGSLAMTEIVEAVGAAAPKRRWRLPKATLPDSLVRVAARVLPEAAQAVPELGARKELVANAAREILGVSFRPPREAIAATVRDLTARRLL